MELNTFCSLPHHEVAQILQEKGPIVCVFPFNGTRRWFMLEHANASKSFGADYMETITARMAEICVMLFEHGIDTLLIPLLSPRLFDARGSQYTQMTLQSLNLLCEHPALVAFYDKFRVRAQFYGDYKYYLSQEPYSESGLLQKFEQLSEKTAVYDQHRIYWGICAHDATRTTTELAIRYYQTHNKIPNTQELIQMYYGEPLSPVNIFITEGKPRAYDMPLLSTGNEDLYFTAFPSPYLSEQQLRIILHDHLFNRPKSKERYHSLTQKDHDGMRSFYQDNANNILGIGKKYIHWGIWYPVTSPVAPGEKYHDTYSTEEGCNH